MPPCLLHSEKFSLIQMTHVKLLEPGMGHDQLNRESMFKYIELCLFG